MQLCVSVAQQSMQLCVSVCGSVFSEGVCRTGVCVCGSVFSEGVVPLQTVLS